MLLAFVIDSVVGSHAPTDGVIRPGTVTAFAGPTQVPAKSTLVATSWPTSRPSARSATTRPGLVEKVSLWLTWIPIPNSGALVRFSLPTLVRDRFHWTVGLPLADLKRPGEGDRL